MASEQLASPWAMTSHDDAAICGLPVNIQLSKNLLVLISSGGNLLFRESWLLLYSSDLTDTRGWVVGGGPGWIRTTDLTLIRGAL